MNLSRNWLNEFVDLHDITDKQFNDEMTLSGSKVETIERLDESLKNVVAGKILSMEKHPDSDHMWVCQLDVGREEPVQIVTGAWNIHIGDLVPAALHKSVLPGGVKIEKGKLRGVPSNGMLCSLKELGLTAEHDFPYAVITPAALLNDYHPIDPAKPSIPASAARPPVPTPSAPTCTRAIWWPTTPSPTPSARLPTCTPSSASSRTASPTASSSCVRMM